MVYINFSDDSSDKEHAPVYPQSVFNPPSLMHFDFSTTQSNIQAVY